MAEACFYLMENYQAADIGELINIGTGEEISIRDLAYLIKKVVGYEGEIVFDTTKKDGTMLKKMDVSKLEKLGWKYKLTLEEGIRETYNDFINNPDVRL
jgi:GDP-L-fucose synthase